MNYPLITLYVPGTRPELIEKAEKSQPDAVIIDLEDTVPINRKNEVRQDISNILSNNNYPTLIRVNNEPGFLKADLKEMVRKNVYAILLPKAEDPDQIHEIDSIMTETEHERGLEKN